MKKLLILLLFSIASPAISQSLTIEDYEAWKAQNFAPSPDAEQYKSFAQKLLEKRNETILKGSPKLPGWLLDNENYRIAADSAEGQQSKTMIALAAIAFAGLVGLFGLWKTRKLVARGASGTVVAIGAGAIIAIRKSVRTAATLRSAMVEQADRRDRQP